MWSRRGKQEHRSECRKALPVPSWSHAGVLLMSSCLLCCSPACCGALTLWQLYLCAPLVLCCALQTQIHGKFLANINLKGIGVLAFCVAAPHAVMVLCSCCGTESLENTKALHGTEKGVRCGEICSRRAALEEEMLQLEREGASVLR